MVTHHPKNSHPPSQNLPEGSVLQTLNFAQHINKIKTRWRAMDGQPPSPGWSPTIQNLPEGSVLQTLNLAPKPNSKNQDQVKCHGWSAKIPWMITHHPPSKIYQKEMYFDICHGCSVTITRIVTNHPWMVPHHPLDGHLSSLGWSPIIQNMVTHLSKDCHPASKGCSPRSQACSPTIQN